MSQLLESTASSEPTPPGTSDPLPPDITDGAAAAPDGEAASPAPADPLADLQKRQHPFGD